MTLNDATKDLEEKSNVMTTLDEIFTTLYSEYPHSVAKETSRRERKDNDYISMSLVYGEISFQPFKLFIDQIKKDYNVLVKPGGVFLDIGSGSGKAVFAAMLAHEFDGCYGIEILEGLHNISMEILKKWDEKYLKSCEEILVKKKRTRLQFTLGDVLEVDWPAHVDVYFLNSTCFSTNFLRDLTRKLNATCKSGAIIVTATHPLPDKTNFHHLQRYTVVQEAWGEATWYVHSKK